jgi:riboflavin synthase
MFTGIITNIAKVKKIEFNENKDCLIAILASKIERELKIGCSIACNGICLTLIKQEGELLYFQASKETCNLTNLSDLKIDDNINLEFSLRLGDEFGGHIVLGHVDGIALLSDLCQIQDSWKMRFVLNDVNLMQFIAKKGSICVNGISLTVNEVGKDFFEVNIIEHTFNATNLNEIKLGNKVNIEVDVVARYIRKAA